MAELNKEEMLRLLAGIRQARLTELNAYKEAWPNPTPKQQKRIEKAMIAYEKAKAQHQTLKSLIQQNF